jgi:hypothetical protein
MPDAMKTPTAFEKLLAEYQKGGEQYQIAPRSYYSTGAFPFLVDSNYTDANGYVRLVLKCEKGTKIDFFSYGINDQVSGVGLPGDPYAATDAETNLAERHQTNNEDMAIEAFGATLNGYRIAYPQLGATSMTGISNEFRALLVGGDAAIVDPASTVIPPEIASSIMLEHKMWQALRSKVSLQLYFDRKASDRVARLNQIPEGGANSYLSANGEPTSHNVFKLHEGYTWRVAEAKKDKLFSAVALVEQDVWALVTLPPLNYSTITANDIGLPSHIWVEWTLFALGRAFYLPSENM